MGAVTGPGLKIGDRVELIHMPNDPDPVPAGTKGTVDWLGDVNITPFQIGVAWDNGRSLILLQGVDQFRRI